MKILAIGDSKYLTYYLKIWGSIENGGLATKLLGTQQRDFWFESEDEMVRFEHKIRQLAATHNRIVSVHKDSGVACNYLPIAIVTLVYDGEEWTFEYKNAFYGHDNGMMSYMFEEGNFSCDCNKRMFLEDHFPERFCFTNDEHMKCGETIMLKNLEVYYIHKNGERITADEHFSRCGYAE